MLCSSTSENRVKRAATTLRFATGLTKACGLCLRLSSMRSQGLATLSRSKMREVWSLQQKHKLLQQRQRHLRQIPRCSARLLANDSNVGHWRCSDDSRPVPSLKGKTEGLTEACAGRQDQLVACWWLWQRQNPGRRDHDKLFNMKTKSSVV